MGILKAVLILINNSVLYNSAIHRNGCSDVLKEINLLLIIFFYLKYILVKYSTIL